MRQIVKARRLTLFLWWPRKQSQPPQPPALFGRHLCSHRLDLHGRELELRDLAVGINRRIGQDIGGGFDIGEGQEHHILGNSPIRPRHDLD